MMRLLSSKAQERNDFWKPFKPYHVGIDCIALAEYSQMSTHVPGFQSFFQEPIVSTPKNIQILHSAQLVFNNPIKYGDYNKKNIFIIFLDFYI